MTYELRQKFQGDISLELFVAREPDDAHAASTQSLDQGVATKQFLTAGEFVRVASSPSPESSELTAGD